MAGQWPGLLTHWFTVAAAVDLLQLRPPKRRDPEAPRLRLAE